MRSLSGLHGSKAQSPHALKHSARKTLIVDNANTIKAGDVVAIFGFRHDSSPFFEGYARIAAKCPLPHFFRVRFCGERVLRTRLVNPEWQKDPKKSLALLREFWRTGISPEFADFFPKIPPE